MTETTHIPPPRMRTRRPEVLVTIPGREQFGGVASYFQSVHLDDDDRVEYFDIYFGWAKAPLVVRLFLIGLMYAKFLLRMLDRQVKVVHVNPSMEFRSLYREMAFCALARMFRKKIIVYWRGWDDEVESSVFGSPLPRFLFRITYGRAERTLVLGTTFKKKLVSSGLMRDNSAIVLVTTAADDLLAKGSWRLRPDGSQVGRSFTLLFLARVEHEKGIITAIDAAAQAAERSSRPVRLIVAGDGDALPEAIRHAKERANGVVEFRGKVLGDQKHRIFEECDALILPTTWGEGMPNAIFEAMTQGLAILTRPIGGIPDHIVDGEHGFLM